jgi:hypothetical protein
MPKGRREYDLKPYESFAAKPSHQKSNESSRIDAHRHVHVRLNRIHANGFEPIAPWDDPVDSVTTISHCLAARESAIGLYIDTHVLRLQERAIDHRPGRWCVVHSAAAKTSALIGSNLKSSNGSCKTCLRSRLALKSRDIGVCNERVFGYIQAHHRDRPAGVKDDRRRFRIAVNVELARPRSHFLR